jgi:deoxyribonuclease IV
MHKHVSREAKLMEKKYKGLLGAHMSIAGGIDQAFIRGHSIGCTTIQIFTHSNRSWRFKDLTEETIQDVKKAQSFTGITKTLAHASYLINFASSSAETVKKSRETLGKELIQCEQLSIPYLVLHPGTGTKDIQEAIQKISDAINSVLDHTPGTTLLLLETMAGQGSSVGYRFEQLAALRNLIHNKKRVGVCFDTCHVWAAGYPFATEKEYKALWHEFDTIIGLEHLKAMHLSDSLKPFGSRLDRHGDIGKGTMGLEPFRLLMNDSRFLYLPKVLETPNHTLEGYAHNLQILENLVDHKKKQ